jgi:hypothetical protein
VFLFLYAYIAFAGGRWVVREGTSFMSWNMTWSFHGNRFITSCSVTSHINLETEANILEAFCLHLYSLVCEILHFNSIFMCLIALDYYSLSWVKGKVFPLRNVKAHGCVELLCNSFLTLVKMEVYMYFPFPPVSTALLIVDVTLFCYRSNLLRRNL